MDLVIKTSWIVLIFVLNSVSSELIIEKDALRNDINLKTVSPDFGKLFVNLHHFDQVKAVATSPSGKLASATVDNQIFIWNPLTSTIERSINNPHNGLISSLAFSQNGYLLSASHDSYAKMWNSNDSYSSKCSSLYKGSKYPKAIWLNEAYYVLANNGYASVMRFGNCYIHRHLNHSSSIPDSVLSLAHIKKEEFASGSIDKTIKIWNNADGALLRTLVGHSDSVTALALLANGHLVSGSADKTIKIWNPNDGTMIRTMTGHTGTISAFAVLPNGYLASSSSTENTIRIWDTAQGIQLYTFIGHTAGINDLALLPNAKLASASIDRVVKVWTAN